MVFVAKRIRYNIPPKLADHLARRWCEETPFEPNVKVLEPGLVFSDSLRIRELEGVGNWFTGNLAAPAAG